MSNKTINLRISPELNFNYKPIPLNKYKDYMSKGAIKQNLVTRTKPRHTGNDNYIKVKNGVLEHNISKTLKYYSHIAKFHKMM